MPIPLAQQNVIVAEPEQTKMDQTFDVHLWFCTTCRDYGRVYPNSKERPFCGQCGTKLQFRLYEIPVHSIPPSDKGGA